jgi:hypothetical protein
MSRCRERPLRAQGDCGGRLKSVAHGVRGLQRRMEEIENRRDATPPSCCGCMPNSTNSSSKRQPKRSCRGRPANVPDSGGADGLPLRWVGCSQNGERTSTARASRRTATRSSRRLRLRLVSRAVAHRSAQASICPRRSMPFPQHCAAARDRHDPAISNARRWLELRDHAPALEAIAATLEGHQPRWRIAAANEVHCRRSRARKRMGDSVRSSGYSARPRRCANSTQHCVLDLRPACAPRASARASSHGPLKRH